MAEESKATSKFDFNAHRESAIKEYESIRPHYLKFTETAKDLIKTILDGANVKYSSIDARTKEIEKFGNKAATPSDSDPMKPKYPKPMENITDMAGLRVITFLPRTVEEVCKIIENEFAVKEKIDKGKEALDEGKIGYQSIHYLVKLHSSRKHLLEYQSYSDLILEIQVRTLCQHAWAEMEHDIQYKSTMQIPILTKRKFIALAGLLDLADQEFQTLQDEYEQKKRQKENEMNRYIDLLYESITSKTLSDNDRKFALDALNDLNLSVESSSWSKELSKKLMELEKRRRGLILDLEKRNNDSHED